ncbi:MAG: hypothetical protein ACE5OZ_11845 [Candidatus Heimdallarchaeota archaeon]
MALLSQIRNLLISNKIEILIVAILSLLCVSAFILDFYFGFNGLFIAAIAGTSLIISVLVYLYGPRIKGPRFAIATAWIKEAYRINESNT